MHHMKKSELFFTPCNEIFNYVIPNRQKALINHQNSLFHSVWSRSRTVLRRAWKKEASQNIFKISFHSDMVIERIWSCFEFCASLLKWLWSEIETMLRKILWDAGVLKGSRLEPKGSRASLSGIKTWIRYLKLEVLLAVVGIKTWAAPMDQEKMHF